MLKVEITTLKIHRIYTGGEAVKYREKVLDRLALNADLPGEVLPGLPLVEIAGESRALVENHSGVTSYGCNEILVKVSFGHLSICGSCLKLARMTKNQLVITGKIDSITLRRGRN